MDDWTLLQDYIDHGSEAAFTTLVRQHLDLVYSAAWRRLEDPLDAEEVAQTVFSQLALKARWLKPGTVLAGWLYRAACLEALARRRVNLRRLQRERDAMASIESAPVNESSWKQIAPFLDEAMLQVREEDRLAILLHYFQNQTLQEVGKTLGLSEDATRMRLRRALEKLRVLLLKKGVTCAPMVLSLLMTERAVQATPASIQVSIVDAAATALKSTGGSLLATASFRLLCGMRTMGGGITLGVVIFLTIAVATLFFADRAVPTQNGTNLITKAAGNARFFTKDTNRVTAEGVISIITSSQGTNPLPLAMPIFNFSGAGVKYRLIFPQIDQTQGILLSNLYQVRGIVGDSLPEDSRQHWFEVQTIQLITAYTDLDRRLIEAAANRDYNVIKETISQGADVNIRSATFKTPLHNLVCGDPNPLDIMGRNALNGIDLPLLAARLALSNDAVTVHIRERLTAGTRNALANFLNDHSKFEPLQSLLEMEWMRILRSSSLYDDRRFNGVSLRSETRGFLLIGLSTNQIGNDRNLIRLNRLLLEDAYPRELPRDAFPEVVQLLLEHGAEIDAIDENRSTPLHYAASRVNIESYSAVVLLMHGANASARDASGTTPWALNSGIMREVMKRLRPHDEPDYGVMGPALVFEERERQAKLKLEQENAIRIKSRPSWKHEAVKKFLESPARDTTECRMILAMLLQNGCGIDELETVYKGAQEVTMWDPEYSRGFDSSGKLARSEGGKAKVREGIKASLMYRFTNHGIGISRTKVKHPELLSQMLDIRIKVPYYQAPLSKPRSMPNQINRELCDQDVLDYVQSHPINDPPFKLTSELTPEEIAKMEADFQQFQKRNQRPREGPF